MDSGLRRFERGDESLRETLCTLGNGYFATRGAAAENDADDTHYPGAYLAGGYDRLTTEIAGRVIENEDLVNLPNWLPLAFRISGDCRFNPLGVELLALPPGTRLGKHLEALESETIGGEAVYLQGSNLSVRDSDRGSTAIRRYFGTGGLQPRAATISSNLATSPSLPP